MLSTMLNPCHDDEIDDLGKSLNYLTTYGTKHHSTLARVLVEEVIRLVLPLSTHTVM